MKLEGKTDEEIECYLQLTYLNRPDNYFKLVRDITNYLVNSYQQPITFLSGISETDFVIRSLALARADEDNEVLVLSVDTDYLVLLSDVEHAYLKKIQTNERRVLYPYEIWREALGEELAFEQIVKLAIVFGCDYNEHSGLITLDTKDVNKNKNNVTALLKSYEETTAHFKTTRLKKIKDALNKISKPNNDDNNDEQSSMSTLDLLVENNFREIYEIYCNWEFNTDFMRYITQPARDNYLKELITNFANKYISETNTKLYESELLVVNNLDEYIDNIINNDVNDIADDNTNNECLLSDDE
jgi:hypothetical protein